MPIGTIWTPGYGTKRQAIMASKRSPADREIKTLDEFGRDVLRRRAALGGEIDIPLNSGKRRTESKKSLLKAIKDVGGKW
jgi:hypothetical protein